MNKICSNCKHWQLKEGARALLHDVDAVFLSECKDPGLPVEFDPTERSSCSGWARRVKEAIDPANPPSGGSAVTPPEKEPSPKELALDRLSWPWECVYADCDQIISLEPGDREGVGKGRIVYHCDTWNRAVICPKCERPNPRYWGL